VVLQQSLADLNTAYRNFFGSVTGKRKGPKTGPPRFKSRKAAGLAVTACRAQVRPGPSLAQRSEAGTHLKSRQETT
jgi:hypothetical protein